VENDFTYEQLSPRAFEQLGVALAESAIGAGNGDQLIMIDDPNRQRPR
jgi:hypothetical protein